jgi:hypothetical protein
LLPATTPKNLTRYSALQQQLLSSRNQVSELEQHIVSMNDEIDGLNEQLTCSQVHNFTILLFPFFIVTEHILPVQTALRVLCAAVQYHGVPDRHSATSKQASAASAKPVRVLDVEIRDASADGGFLHQTTNTLSRLFFGQQNESTTAETPTKMPKSMPGSPVVPFSFGLESASSRENEAPAQVLSGVDMDQWRRGVVTLYVDLLRVALHEKFADRALSESAQKVVVDHADMFTCVS